MKGLLGKMECFVMGVKSRFVESAGVVNRLFFARNVGLEEGDI